MPRRPTTTDENVPLFLVPHVVMQGICEHGREVEWIMARRTAHHYYTVRVRTRPVKREMRPESREQTSVDRIFKKIVRGQP
jgi:hypothetical protein